MKKLIQPLKGTRDFYPEEKARHTWLYEQLRAVSESFGYMEYEAPYLESIELYAAKSGDELVKEQAFVFPDRGGDLITLRPELTPSLARMVAQRQRELVYPLRWWSWGPMWRYERPQKGRTREFFQWNIDLLGIDSVEADAELIAVVAAFFRRVGLSSSVVQVRINNRRLMNTVLGGIGIPPELRPTAFHLIDRKAKLQPAAWEAYAIEQGLTAGQVTELNQLLSQTALWEDSAELRRLFADLQALGASEYVRYDPSIIRGLEYYTGTVFEAVEVEGEIRRAVLGGGRYDNLLADVGGESLPGVGFAMGDVVISLLLDKHGCFPSGLTRAAGAALVTVFNDATLPASLALAAELRDAGLTVLLYPEAAKLNKQFKYADRIGVGLALVLGEDEIQNNQVTVKDLASGAQETVARASLSSVLKNRLAA